MSDDWREALPADERAIYERAGFGRRGGHGDAPAVIVVDVTYGFAGHRGVPADESLAAYPNSCGDSAWPAVDAIAVLVEAARAHDRPVVYTRDVSGESLDSAWQRKHGRLADRPADHTTVVEEIAPRPGELVVDKTVPSAFFGNDLARRLRDAGVSDILVTGTSTSGCVRASVVDAFSHGFGVTVVADCVFDRTPTSHRVSLFEMDQKYGDVIDLAEAVRVLAH